MGSRPPERVTPLDRVARAVGTGLPSLPGHGLESRSDGPRHRRENVSPGPPQVVARTMERAVRYRETAPATTARADRGSGPDWLRTARTVAPQAASKTQTVIAVSLASVAPLDRWVGWRNELRNNKIAKVPFSPRTGRMAKADDPTGWARRTEAEAWARTHVNGRGGGIGLQLGPVQGEDYSLGGVDLDTCRDPATGRIEPWALEVIRRLDSYAEVSPSGTGVKLFLLYATGDLLPLREVMGTEHGRQFKCGTGEHPPAIELHLGNRYFAVTDQHVECTSVELRLVDKQALLWLLTQAGPALRRSAGPGTEFGERPQAEASAAAAPRRGEGHGLRQAADAAVLAKLQKAMRQRPNLASRWNGSTDGLHDASRSGMDMSMTAMLKQAQFDSMKLVPHVIDDAGNFRIDGSAPQ
jgi:hypothetical protein